MIHSIKKNFYTKINFACLIRFVGGKIMKTALTIEEKEAIETGEIALTTVLAICAIAIVAVVVYRMFMSQEGSTTIPGGWKFTWK